jgi:hypothetical protein
MMNFLSHSKSVLAAEPTHNDAFSPTLASDWRSVLLALSLPSEFSSATPLLSKISSDLFSPLPDLVASPAPLSFTGQNVSVDSNTAENVAVLNPVHEPVLQIPDIVAAGALEVGGGPKDASALRQITAPTSENLSSTEIRPKIQNPPSALIPQAHSTAAKTTPAPVASSSKWKSHSIFDDDSSESTAIFQSKSGDSDFGQSAVVTARPQLGAAPGLSAAASSTSSTVVSSALSLPDQDDGDDEMERWLNAAAPISGSSGASSNQPASSRMPTKERRISSASLFADDTVSPTSSSQDDSFSFLSTKSSLARPVIGSTTESRAPVNARPMALFSASSSSASYVIDEEDEDGADLFGTKDQRKSGF